MSGTPEEIFRQGLELLLAKDMDGFADLWAEDGIIEYPFAAPDAPTRVEGREEVRRYMSRYPEMADIKEFPSVTVHLTQDPEIVIAEFVAQGIAVRTGEPYEMRYIAVVTVHDKSIVSYRDYWSPLMGAAALGELPALISALEERLEERVPEKTQDRGRV